MVSIQRNNDRLIRSQLQWRGNADHKWSTKSRHTNLFVKKAVPEAAGNVEPRGALRPVQLTPKLFQLFEDEWADKNKDFSRFRDRYRSYVKKCQNKGKPALPMADWKDSRISEDEQQWQPMSHQAWSVSMACLDGVLFRTEKHEIRKKCKTTNRYIIGQVRVRVPNQSKTTTVNCYGVVKELYVHFMSKPEQSTYKLTAAKLAKFKEPWILCAICEWYEDAGTNPVNGLPQIRPNKHWQEDCPLINLHSCIGANVAFWPSNPFDASHFDEHGCVLAEHGPIYNFGGCDQQLFDVIMMHQTIK